MAERVGFFAVVVEYPNEDGPFWRNARDVNDLASSNFCRRLRPLAAVCRFFHRDDTRDDTRCDWLQGCLPRESGAGATVDIFLEALQSLLNTTPASEFETLRSAAMPLSPAR